jgi:hypothetical protein
MVAARASAGGRSALSLNVTGKVYTVSTQHVSWQSIELLHNVVRTLRHLNEFPTVRYRAKVKLHGTNAAVQATPEGVFAQSRTQILTPQADYKGFAAWVKRHEAFFAQRAHSVVFGEWCGLGIEKGMAISQVPTKLFVVFAIQLGDRIVDEPAEIRSHLGAEIPPELHVLPWDGDEFTLDFGDEAALERVTATLNARIEVVEREDPWVKAQFGISGLGEGLVLYPIAGATSSVPASTLMFKAKGEKHRTVHAKAAVQVEATAAGSVDAFVALVVTEARLAQGVAAVGGDRNPKQTGAFITWIAGDVVKECAAELEAAGLTWTQVDKAVRAFARIWFTKRT